MVTGTKFPVQSRSTESEPTNLANGLFGLRFHPGQTPVEYLAEFLLVVGSPKRIGKGAWQADQVFPPASWDGVGTLSYQPRHRVPLKLFSFFSTSKLETRHESHRAAFEQGLEKLKQQIAASDADKESFLRGLQALFNGFAGVAGGRTWVSQAFLPISRSLLAREVMWQHTGKDLAHHGGEWDEAIADRFHVNKHNFFARGGEHLYLQLAQLFARFDDPVLEKMRAQREYEHLRTPRDELRADLETGLNRLIGDLDPQLAPLVSFIDEALEPLTPLDKLDKQEGPDGDGASFGWIPATCLPEALLFAHELRNLLRCKMDALQRVEALQTLCNLQVMRCFCVQAMRYEPGRPIDPLAPFTIAYAWIMAPSDRDDEMRGLAQQGLRRMKQAIDGATRGGLWPDQPKRPPEATHLRDAEKHGFKLFQHLGKSLGMIVPTRGPRPPHMVLPDHVIRMLVPALLDSGRRLREKEFEQRLYHHYGVVLGDDRARAAAAWLAEPGAPVKDKWPSPAWFTEALRAGGFLIPLSDAVSMVCNPY